MLGTIADRFCDFCCVPFLNTETKIEDNLAKRNGRSISVRNTDRDQLPVNVCVFSTFNSEEDIFKEHA